MTKDYTRIEDYLAKKALRRLLSEEMPKFFARGGEIKKVMGGGSNWELKRSYRHRAAPIR